MPTPDEDELEEFLEPDDDAAPAGLNGAAAQGADGDGTAVADAAGPGKKGAASDKADAAKTDAAKAAAQDAAGEPAWRRRLRASTFGQIAVLLVVAFAVAIVAWLTVKPKSEGPEQAESSVVSQVQVEGAARPPAVGEKAPDFTAKDLADQEVALAKMQGKPVWLVFAATWCTGCRTEMPDVQEAIKAHGNDVQLVVIYNGEDAATVKAYSERVGNDFTQVADADQKLSAAYGVMGVPAHYFIGADGVVKQTHVGLLSPAKMDEAITATQGS